MVIEDLCAKHRKEISDLQDQHAIDLKETHERAEAHLTQVRRFFE